MSKAPTDRSALNPKLPWPFPPPGGPTEPLPEEPLDLPDAPF